MKLAENITEFVQECLTDPALFLLEIKVLPKNRILILLDGDVGVSVDQCARVSRYVGNKIEETALIDHAYTLEVSSPGLDHPLLLHRQYVKNVGRNVSIKMNDGKIRIGKLKEIKDTWFLLEEKVKEKGKKPYLKDSEIKFTDIKEAKVVINF